MHVLKCVRAATEESTDSGTSTSYWWESTRESTQVPHYFEVQAGTKLSNESDIKLPTRQELGTLARP